MKRTRRSEARSDLELVTRCRAGDESAWAALVERHSGLVWTVARRVGLSDADASDVFQTVWRIAVEQIGRLRHPERFARWIARTTQFQSLRLRRDYAISRRALERIPATDTDGPLPEEEIETLEQRRRVAEALAQLGDRCQDLLRTLYFENPTPRYAEISRRLGMPVGSIGPTRARCLEKLERRLAPGQEG